MYGDHGTIVGTEKITASSAFTFPTRIGEVFVLQFNPRSRQGVDRIRRDGDCNGDLAKLHIFFGNFILRIRGDGLACSVEYLWIVSQPVEAEVEFADRITVESLQKLQSFAELKCLFFGNVKIAFHEPST